MSKYMKSFLCALFLIVPFVSFAYVNPGKPTGHVNDFASVLTPDQKINLESKLVQFEASTTNEVSVVVVKSLQGDYVENYTNKLFNEWGIGKKDKNNGVLVLVAMDDRKMRIEVGYGLEGVIPDATAKHIIDNIMKPPFKEGKYYVGIDSAVDSLIGVMSGTAEPAKSSGSIPLSILFVSFWGLLIISFVIRVIMGIVFSLGRTKHWWVGGVWGAVIGGFFYYIGLGIYLLIGSLLFGLLLDFILSTFLYNKIKELEKRYKADGKTPWWIGGRNGRGGGGFGGFGGGGSGGGGASGGW